MRLGTAIRSEAELAWDHTEAYLACRKLILENVSFTEETDIHDLLGKSVREVDTTHRVVVNLDFDAKNAFGVENAFTARSYFDPGSTAGTIEIFDLSR